MVVFLYTRRYNLTVMAATMAPDAVRERYF
jgi:hypothetical protein